MACRDLFAVVQHMAEELGVSLLLDLPPGLTADQRGKLLNVFEFGRVMIIFGFTMKVSVMCEPPWLAFGIGHFDDAKQEQR